MRALDEARREDDDAIRQIVLAIAEGGRYRFAAVALLLTGIVVSTLGNLVSIAIS